MDSHKDQKYYIYCAFFNLVLGVSRRSPGDLSGEEIPGAIIILQNLFLMYPFGEVHFQFNNPLTNSKYYYNYCDFCNLDSLREQKVL